MEALAVKYRPKRFEDVCGQRSIITILNRFIESGQFKNTFLFCGASGCGKAQPLTSKVFTPTGYTTMKEIKVGDTVVDGKGNITKVLGVFPQGERKTYRIHFNDNTFIDVADNHINSVFRYNSSRHKKEYFEVTTEHLIDLVNSSPYQIRVETPIIDCWSDNNIDIDPYLLGALIGDGSLHNNFGFSNIDDDILKAVESRLNIYGLELNKCTDCDYTIRLANRISYKYIFKYDGKQFLGCTQLQSYLISKGYPKFDSGTLIKLAFNSAKSILHKFPELKDAITYEYIEEGQEANKLKQQLKNYNLLVKSSEKRIPINYLYSSVETRTQLLQGLFDTDGYISKGGSLSITISNKGLAEDIQFLIRSLGMVCCERCSSGTYTYSYKGISEIHDRLTSYTIYIKRREDFSFFKCSRKLQRQIASRFEPRRAISKIEEINKQECQCIYVESSEHTYLTDNLTVTHNTTIARIFANAINKGQGTPIELDAASHNGVEDIRAISNEAKQRAVDAEYKVYIIDECHALSNAAWQAFLKTIEEPPRYTIFIFCTTDPQKIPATILNRCMRFNFNRISSRLINERLSFISQCEGFTNYAETCDYISKICSGQMRDAISLLEKVASYDTNLDINAAYEALGNYSYDVMFNLANACIDQNIASILDQLDNIYNEGNDMKLFINKYLEFALDISKYILMQDIGATKLPVSAEQKVKFSINFDNAAGYYYYLVDRLLELKNMLKTDVDVMSTIKVMMIKIARMQ